MKIVGIGTDIVKVSRIDALLKKSGQEFLAKILNPIEYEGKELSASFIAKRFAAKEAISKAYGTGIGQHLAFLDIIVTNNESGKPEAHIKFARDLRIELSLADESEYAVAYAIIIAD